MEQTPTAVPSLPQRYRSLRRIGSGGTATVVLVEDLSGQPSTKALKILRPDLPPEVVAAFRKEFRILACLEHPGLARVYEFGELADGRPFYTAEFVEGVELGRAALGVRETCLALAAVARTLAYLHARGYVHNDVKPANIVVGGAPEEARLLDFGLAGLDRASGRNLAGTPGYVAPERLSGEPWDARADLYAVGATLYRLLGGRPVTSRVDRHEALEELRSGSPPLGRLRPDLPDALGRLVDELVAFDLARRPRHAAEVVMRLGDAIGCPIPLETPGSARAYALSGVLVARRAELARVGAVLRSSNGPRVAGLRAGPGMGKTRLLREIGWQAEAEGLRVVTFAGDERGAEACIGSAADRPTVAVVDDAHRATDAVWRAVAAATRRRDQGRPNVLLAFDGEAMPSSSRVLWSAAIAAGDAIEVALGPLPEDELRRAVGRLFGEKVIPADLERSIVTRAGGSPLLLEEIVRELIETGVLRSSASGWFVAPASTAAPPRSDRLEDFLARRCRSLGEEDLGVLAAVAAFGGRAGPSAVQVAARPDSDVALAAGRLAERALVDRRDDDIALAPPALAEVVRTLLAPGEWAETHLRAARWLEEQGAPPADLARAWKEAGLPARAFRHAVAAGRQALADGEGRRAVHWLEEARSLAGAAQSTAGERGSLLADLGEAHRMAGHSTDALDCLEAAHRSDGMAPAALLRVAVAGVRVAIEAADASADAWLARARAITAALAQDPLAEAEVEYLEAMLAWDRGRVAEARRHLGRSLALAGSGSARARILRARVLAPLSVVEMYFEGAAARRLAAEAVAAAAEVNDALLIERAHNNRAVVEGCCGDVALGAALFREALDEAERQGRLGSLSHLLADLAEVEHDLGDFQAGRERLDRAVALAGDERSTGEAQATEAACAFREGDHAAAEAAASRGLANPAVHDNRMMLLLVAAAGAAERGAAPEAARQAEAAAAQAAEAGAPWHDLWAGLARAYAVAPSDPRRAGAALRDGARGLAALGRRDFRAAILRDAAAWLARAGDRAEARACASEARADLDSIGCRAGIERLDRHLRLVSVRRHGRQPPAGLGSIFSARSLDELADLVRAHAAAAGARGEIRLYGSLDGDVRALGSGGPGDEALRRQAAAALLGGRPSSGPGAVLLPILGRRFSICLAVTAPSADAGPLLPEALRAALALLEARTEERRRDGPATGTAASWTVLAARGAPPSRALELTLGRLELGHEYPAVVGRSRAMRRTLVLVDKLADSDVSVLLSGETGTGKEVLARALHAAGSRRTGPFVAVDCAALPGALFEAEIFGYRRGAFTGAVADHRGLAEQASHGVLFLDEVGELPLTVQPKLLRLLQERSVRPLGAARDVMVDVRIVAATHRDLRRAVADGTFRDDLYFRLGVVEVRLPPLRERLDDLPALCRHLLGRQAARAPAFSAGAIRCLERYSWPGNVRELENELARASLLAGGGPIQRNHLSAHLRTIDTRSGANPAALPARLAEAERRILREALAAAAGNRTRAAAALGIGRPALHYRMKRLGVV